MKVQVGAILAVMMLNCTDGGSHVGDVGGHVDVGDHMRDRIHSEAGSSSDSDVSIVDAPADSGTGDQLADKSGGDTNDLTDVDSAERGSADADVVLPPFPALPLHVEGRHITDSAGRRLRLMGVNWNGANEEKEVPHGLGFHSPEDIAARIAQLGFNSVRLTWSNELVETDTVPDPIHVAGWPEGVGMTSMEVLDAVVDALTTAGIMVILNNHSSDSMWCCNDGDGNGLWYTDKFPEDAWVAHWVSMAQRYVSNPLVIGADLRNELRETAQWGSDASPEFDWPSAAELCAEAVLEVRPDWLIFVEGVKYAVTLEGVQERPVVLSLPGRLVYSVHNYSWSITSLVDTPEFYDTTVQQLWGHVLEPPVQAPVWLGEFGTCNDCWSSNWVKNVTRAIKNYDLDWSLWLLFGTPGGGWGLLSEETLQVNSADIIPLLTEWGLAETSLL